MALDLVGCCFSEKPLEWNYTLRGQGKLVASFLQKLDLMHVVLLGHSSGANVAAAAAALAPDRVCGTVFISPGFFQIKSSYISHWAMLPFFNIMVEKILRNRVEACGSITLERRP